MPFNTQKYDTEKFIDGEWTDFDGGRFKVAKNGNAEHQAARKRLMREAEAKYGKDITSDQEEEVHARVMAEGLLLDWEDVQDGDGKTVPYSKSNAARVLLEYPPLVAHVMQKSNDMSLFEREKIEESAEKPGASSGGGKTGGKATSKPRTPNTSE